MQIHPYLYFEGRCEEAVEFYRGALGAEVMFLMRFKDSPDPHELSRLPAGAENKVLHTTFRIGGITMQASDGQCLGEPSFQGFSLALTMPGYAEAERVFASLADGGHVEMPLTKTFFSPGFGVVVDRFGVAWKVHVAS
jgi:PhnB protein